MLVGATLFLSSVQHRWLNRALVLGAWILSALPFCLTAAAWVPSPAILDWSLPVFLIAQAMLLAGYFHHALRPMARQPADPNQVWVRGVYPLGILSLLLVALVLGVWGWADQGKPGAADVSRLGLGVAYAALGEPRKAIQFYEQALEIDREIGDRHGEGAALGNLGLAYADLGETHEGVEP